MMTKQSASSMKDRLTTPSSSSGSNSGVAVTGGLNRLSSSSRFSRRQIILVSGWFFIFFVLYSTAVNNNNNNSRSSSFSSTGSSSSSSSDVRGATEAHGGTNGEVLANRSTTTTMIRSSPLTSRLKEGEGGREVVPGGGGDELSGVVEGLVENRLVVTTPPDTDYSSSTEVGGSVVPRCRIKYFNSLAWNASTSRQGRAGKRIRRSDLLSDHLRKAGGWNGMLHSSSSSVSSRSGDLLAPGEWPFRREISCEAPLTGASSASGDKTGSKFTSPSSSSSSLKGRALVIYMVSGEWNSTHPSRIEESTNFNYFLHFGYIAPNISTKLFSGADYIFYRRSNVSRTVEMPEGCFRAKERDTGSNVRVLFVPLSTRCDLCGHGLVLQYLNYQERAENGTWPYKSVIVLNSGTRGPFLSDEEHLKAVHQMSNGEKDVSTWLDIVSIGEGERPLYMADDLEEHWTTISGSNLNTYVGGHPHLQSMFLSIPVAALPFYYKLLLHGGCTDALEGAGPANTKNQCIFMGELKQTNFLYPERNGLSAPNPKRVRTLGLSRDRFRERLSKTDGSKLNTHDEASIYRFWMMGVTKTKPGGIFHKGMQPSGDPAGPVNGSYFASPILEGWDEIYSSMFFKFGGHSRATKFKRHPKRVAEINEVSRRKMEVHPPATDPNILRSHSLTKKLFSVRRWTLDAKSGRSEREATQRLVTTQEEEDSSFLSSLSSSPLCFLWEVPEHPVTEIEGLSAPARGLFSGDGGMLSCVDPLFFTFCALMIVIAAVSAAYYCLGWSGLDDSGDGLLPSGDYSSAAQRSCLSCSALRSSLLQFSYFLVLPCYHKQWFGLKHYSLSLVAHVSFILGATAVASNSVLSEDDKDDGGSSVSPSFVVCLVGLLSGAVLRPILNFVYFSHSNSLGESSTGAGGGKEAVVGDVPAILGGRPPTPSSKVSTKNGSFPSGRSPVSGDFVDLSSSIEKELPHVSPTQSQQQQRLSTSILVSSPLDSTLKSSGRRGSGSVGGASSNSILNRQDSSGCGPSVTRSGGGSVGDSQLFLTGEEVGSSLDEETPRSRLQSSTGLVGSFSSASQNRERTTHRRVSTPSLSRRNSGHLFSCLMIPLCTIVSFFGSTNLTTVGTCGMFSNSVYLTLVLDFLVVQPLLLLLLSLGSRLVSSANSSPTASGETKRDR